MAAYRAGIEALMQDAKANPKRAAIRYILSQAQQGLGKTLGNSKRLVESIATYRKALLSAREAAEISPKIALYQNWLYLAHISLGDALKANNQLEEARIQFHESYKPLQAALRLNPNEAVYHKNTRHLFERIIEVNEALIKQNPENQNLLFNDLEWALRQSLYAAWKAKAFSSDKQRNEQNINLVLAKRDLGKFLTFEKNNSEQALPLMEQARNDAEQTVGNSPKNPEYHCRLGEIDYAIGFLLRSKSLPGWEESIRKGLLAIDWGIKIAARDEPLCFMFSGLYRKKLGEYLLHDGRREEGNRELEMALSASQTALKHWPEHEQIKQAIKEQRKLLKLEPNPPNE